MKAFEVQKLHEAFTSLSNEKMDYATACIIVDNIDALENPMKVYNQMRDDVIKKYADKDENGELIVTDKGAVHINDLVSFNNEIMELNESEIEVEIKKISSALIERMDITPSMLKVLRPHIN